ncbi:hypothetical protein [Listeria monocytogenes]|uniref:hypothetical protein n=2 Tax=Listeria monocytogenes TaxID=1639 RepID=UPI001495172B|nr:hypothetical protein [Listeria monocytogenes]
MKEKWKSIHREEVVIMTIDDIKVGDVVITHHKSLISSNDGLVCFVPAGIRQIVTKIEENYIWCRSIIDFDGIVSRRLIITSVRKVEGKP